MTGTGPSRPRRWREARPIDTTLRDSTFIVVPLYNEESVIGDVVAGLREVFPLVVCVDDGCTDASAARAVEAGSHLVQHPFNLGQGAALQTGIDFALLDPRTKFIVTFDSDGQHRVEDAVALVERLAEGDIDIAVGSRFLDGRTKPGALKSLVLRTATLVQRLSSGLDLTDAHNGLRALTRETATILRITQNRMAHASQIVSEIARLELRVAEVPVHIEYTEYSRSKGQSLWNSVNILSDLILK